ncbi:hypothetical protein [Trinickia sp.]|uniref:hypothetical protein n=1 Tax=Trinickia sp. TaxID=2571163 RepID=UPI003F7ECB59
MADSSSSAAAMQSSEFCIEIPQSVVSTFATGTVVQINIQGRAPKNGPMYPVYFQSVDQNFGVGKDGDGLKLFTPETQAATAVPLASFSMSASQIMFVIGPAAKIKASLRLNAFLWSDANVAEVQLTGSIPQGTEMKYGWEHNSTQDTMNFYQWVSWGS